MRRTRDGSAPSLEPFPVRASSSLVTSFSESECLKAQELLNSAPADFMKLNWMSDLIRTTVQYPLFAPGWFMLSKTLAQAGKQAEADGVYKKYLALSP